MAQDARQVVLAEHVDSLQGAGNHALQLRQQAVLQQLLCTGCNLGTALACTPQHLAWTKQCG